MESIVWIVVILLNKMLSEGSVNWLVSGGVTIKKASNEYSWNLSKVPKRKSAIKKVFL